MANPFDQFDQRQEEQVSQNFFDQFDQRQEEQVSQNFFDQFDGASQEAPVEAAQPSFGKDLTREQIISNPEYMQVIEQDLMLRQGGQDLIGGVARGAKWLAGGASTQMSGDMTPEEKFDMWQKNQRSLAAGQTVTLGNELALVKTISEEDQAKLRDSYKLFDSMGNIFTGEGTWSETLGGLYDYVEATIWDPTTVLSLGVGRAYTAGGAKAAAVALKESVEKGAELVAKEALKNGATRVAADAAGKAAGQQAFKAGTEAIAKQVAKKQGLALVGTEFVASVGKDVLYQKGVLMPTGTEEEYSYTQTALAGVGALAVPALIYGAKGLATGVEKAAENLSKKYNLTNQFQTYKDVAANATKMSKDEITEAVKKRTDLNSLNSVFKDSFEKFEQFKDQMPSWTKAKQDAQTWLDEGGIELAASKHKEGFFRYFMDDSIDADGKQISKGFYNSLKEAGFVYVPRDADDTFTNFIGDAISWLDDSLVEAAVKSYEKAAGVKLGMGYAAKDVSSSLKLQESLAGQYLNLMSIGSRKLGKNTTLKDLEDYATKVVNGESDEFDAAYLAYTQSVWKRLLTSHPATTAINLVGFGEMSLRNAMSDVIHAGLNGAVGVGKAVTGKGDAAASFRTAKGSLAGAGRRAVNVLNWDATIKEAESLLELRPDISKNLFTVISGDSGVKDARTFYKVGEDKWYINAAEKYTQGMQKISGVILQDEMTKLWGFMGNFDQAIMREYGVPYSEFMKKSDWVVEMATDRFNKKVLGPAMERTQRETGSYTWSDKQGKSPALKVAKAIETASNSSVFGWVIPFGRWFNTATAFTSDYTGASLIYNSAIKKAKVKGSQDVDLIEYAAKAAVGWGLVAAMYPEARERVDNGDPWNIRVLKDGTREDITDKFPENLTSYTAQVLAHAAKDGEVPKNLAWSGVQTFFTSTFKTSSDAIEAFRETVDEMFEGNLVGGIGGLIGQGIGKIVSGATRPLDPVNKAIMLFGGDMENPDRRQGAKWLNEATRYVDQIFNTPDLEPRQSPTVGTTRVDVVKSFTGIGTKSTNTLADKMFASIGSEAWREVKWQGDPMVKNRMDGILSTLINNRARTILAQYPDFFEKDLDSRIRLVDQMKEVARKDAKAIFESGVSDKDTALVALSKLNQFSDKRALKYAQDALKVDDLAELVSKPGGAEQLQTILDYATAYRDRLID
jgi:ribosomal protein S17E